MNKYFYNPELKKSSFIMVILAISTLFITIITINSNYENIKKGYMENNMALIGGIIKKHPELKKEIVPLVLKAPKEYNIQYGKEILKEYGINENLEIEFIPTMKFSNNIALKNIIITLCLFFVIVLLYNYVQYIKIYKRLERIILASENMLDSNFDIGIYENSEGIFSKLAYSFNNMRVVIKNNFLEIQKEKKFLVDILSDISHQLKTPVSALVVYNDILLNRKLNEVKRKEFLYNSSRQLNRIDWLIKSLLKLAKLDAGVINFDKNKYDLNMTVKEAVDTLISKAYEEKVKLIFNSSESKILFLHDKNWLCESIINLIKNALEHTQKGGTVQVYTKRTPICTKIVIKDNGNGISKKELPHIFKRFYKGSRNKTVESVGIGLALSKSIVEEHNGMIEVKSKEGEGTTFTIIFLSYSQ
ncbi:HAMP domain-containing sensor histidine kinase [Clostridium rectalis]|uniref:HAMP domain-containing sensor histidine kinase n=1 Tax=Clostridium rectalis TaxID=2040295 RepID=UPI000F636D50|nr:HAMP domain-containing sensor histidine kinase [Clostridium rectalis]